MSFYQNQMEKFVSLPPPPSCASHNNILILQENSRRPESPFKSDQSDNGERKFRIYKGITRLKRTGRYEAHLWDNSRKTLCQNKKGKQGTFDDAKTAARIYDLAALKFLGSNAILNFPLNTYIREHQEMQHLTKEEFLAFLKRKSKGFSRGESQYRGVSRHRGNGRWEARLCRATAHKYLFLGSYETEEEAAKAYDLAAIQHRGIKAVTNFDRILYRNELAAIQQQREINQVTNFDRNLNRNELAAIQHEREINQVTNFDRNLCINELPAVQHGDINQVTNFDSNLYINELAAIQHGEINQLADFDSSLFRNIDQGNSYNPFEHLPQLLQLPVTDTPGAAPPAYLADMPMESASFSEDVMPDNNGGKEQQPWNFNVDFNLQSIMPDKMNSDLLNIDDIDIDLFFEEMGLIGGNETGVSGGVVGTKGDVLKDN